MGAGQSPIGYSPFIMPKHRENFNPSKLAENLERA
jgi:hypothetical protein